MNLRTRLSLLKSKVFMVGKDLPNYPNFFIISPGRSGSTLLRKSLIQGGEVYIPPESNDWIAQLFITATRNPFLSWPTTVSQCLSILKSDSGFQYWPISARELQKVWEELPRSQRNARSLVSALYELSAQKEGARPHIIGDKTPYITEVLPWIKAFNPEAKYVFIYRDPRAVVHSRMKYFNETVEMATHRWISAVRNVQNAKLGSNKLKWVRYEDFVVNPEQELKAICQFLEIEFKPEMLAFQEVNLGDTSLSHHQKTMTPISSKHASAWKDEANTEVIEWVEGQTSTLAKKLGY